MIDPAFLTGIDIFTGLTEDQLQRIAAICQEVEFAQDDIILHEHAQSGEMYLVVQGEVEVVVNVNADYCPFPATDGQLSMVTLGAGQIFGEMALVDQGLRSATVRCTATPTRLLALPHNTFIALCEADARLGYVVMRNIAADVCFKMRTRNLTWK